MALEIRSTKEFDLETPSITLPVIELDVSGLPVRFVTTARGSVKRARTLLDKEPLTVPWVSTFAPGEVMYDVGANVGTYAIYGGVHGCRVFAFEPEALNYAELNKNIHVNGLHGQVTAYCMAISDKIDVATLFLSQFSFAGSHHDFGQNRWADGMKIGGRFIDRDSRPQQGCVSWPIDDLVARGVAPTPHHIKIDVDGFEYKVVNGAMETIQGPDLKTLLLEVDFKIPESLELVDRMRAMGWKTSQHQLRINQHTYMEEGRFEHLLENRKGGANFIFFRDDSYYDFFENFASTFVPPNPHK